ncbi:MAG: PAS domain S-box protein [Anaerolineaceae bacterium]|nr:PAS domain S-box protein [Anaerolineaceae bacterium]
MTDQPDSSIEQLMAENGRLQQELTTLHTQIQHLQARQNRREKALERIDIVQVVTDAIIVTDTQYLIQSWNHAAEKMYGWQAEEVLGQSFNELVETQFSDETLEEVREMFLVAEYWKGRVWQRRKDGVLIPILAAVTPIKDDDGRIIGAVAVNRDITNQMEIEAGLRERSRTLEARNEDLAQFAYAASHDLQEPLRMITSYLQLLSQRYSGQLDEEADEFIAYAFDGATRMRQLIADLLAYAKIGRNNLVYTEVSLERVLRQVLANLDLRIQENQVTITYDPLPTVMAEKTQMLQLFQNLLSNAIKFRNQTNPTIHISAHQDQAKWVIQVTDNGIGMDPKLSEKIFVIFQRLHTRQEYPGTGIGLAICKKIVQNHGGTIWVQSEPGAGATFTFTLPISTEKAAVTGPGAS